MPEISEFDHWKTAKELYEEATDREVREAVEQAEGSA
jgi:hypothetical protein